MDGLVFVNARAFTEPGMARRIALIRESRGLTQTDLARAMGVSQPTVSRLERNPGDVKIGHILKMCEVLRVSIDVLASDDFDRLASIEGLTPAQVAELLALRRPA